ncbi:MAG: NINE protein [Burkholderiales bacterium]|nr:MAG: NINE protein [Burkholderiales bacterium]
MPTETSASSDGSQPAPFRSRTVAALLAALLGLLGAHRLYVGARWWWVYPALGAPAVGWAVRQAEWYRSGGFVLATGVILVAMLEAIVWCLTPDEKWDARFNARSTRRSANRWAPVLIAVATLMFGASLMMAVLAIALETYFEARRLQ